MVRLLHNYVSSEQQFKYIELVMKCLWRIIKCLPGWATDIDCDYVLLDVHYFLKEYPSSWWRTKDVDTPLRTIKTLLQSLAKLKGTTLMLHLGKIQNIKDSEIEQYILRLLEVNIEGNIL